MNDLEKLGNGRELKVVDISQWEKGAKINPDYKTEEKQTVEIMFREETKDDPASSTNR
jgi:hypothetical protein